MTPVSYTATCDMQPTASFLQSMLQASALHHNAEKTSVIYSFGCIGPHAQILLLLFILGIFKPRS